MRGVAAAALLMLGACAGPSVLLLPDEDPHPSQGKVAVLERKGKPQDYVIDQANSRTRLAYRPASRVLSEKRLPKRSVALVGSLPPKPFEVTLYYDEAETRIMPDSQAALDSLLAEVAKRPGAEIQITGYTDRKGTDDDNDALSQKRADTVLAQFIDRGVARENLVAVGRGERDPLVPTDDNVEEPRNRRVVVTVR
ncbi:OmpA family protein [Sphingomonas tabacisoli]|uniref:OmpA family protein n=1 Tax=Sphingomonas tabacisoli TaxID=2249466 RepID=A0ABW4I2W2_9SPHN